MKRWIKNVYFLSGKEIRSFFSDYTLLVLVIIMFTVMIIPSPKASRPKSKMPR